MKIAAGGFTLLEILVALVVLGLVLAGLEQGLHFGLAIAKKTDASIHTAADLESTDRVIRNLLGHVDLGGDTGDDGAFKGTRDSLRFSGLLPDGVASERHAEMTLLADDQHRLVLRWRPAPHVATADPGPLPVTTEILDHVDHLELSYGPSGMGNGWKSSWAGDIPPRLVRMLIVPSDARSKPWPAIIVALPNQ